MYAMNSDLMCFFFLKLSNHANVLVNGLNLEKKMSSFKHIMVVIFSFLLIALQTSMNIFLGELNNDRMLYGQQGYWEPQDALCSGIPPPSNGCC